MQPWEIESEIRDFVISNFLFGKADGLTDDESLLENGIIDSTGVLELVGFLQERFDIVAATNLKQRTRKMVEYYHADRLNFAVAGTPNRLEYELGFFVKGGDGLADFKPIAHLYKSQVYRLAEYLKIPEEIRSRPPSTDTYPLEQSQEEFYFSMPLDQMDLCLYGRDHSLPPDQLVRWASLDADQIRRAYSMIDRKRAIARFLHSSPVTFPTPEEDS